MINLFRNRLGLARHLKVVRFIREFGAVGLVIVICGCGGSGLTQVGGTAMVDGKALPSGTVTFVPDGNAERGSGMIGPDGKYSLTTARPGDGVKPGKYKVMVVSFASPPQMDKPGSGKLAVAAKYTSAGTTDLVVNVSAGAPQIIDLQLKDK